MFVRLLTPKSGGSGWARWHRLFYGGHDVHRARLGGHCRAHSGRAGHRDFPHAARALALGATAVTVSISSLEQTQELLRLRTDWHRLIHLRRFPTAADFPAFAQRVAEETLIVPTIESEGGLHDLEAIFALDGVQLVWLAAGDISKILGVPFQYEHPKMLTLLERAVALGERHEAGVMYNLGLDSPDFDTMVASARRFFDLGVRVVGLGAVEWHLQMALSALRQQTLGKRSA